MRKHPLHYGYEIYLFIQSSTPNFDNYSAYKDLQQTPFGAADTISQ